jgi:LacI family gluconate utilization system Gnt-I transcriptional repressor
LILTGIVHSPEGRRQLAAAGIPVVETWDLTPTPIDMLVGFSHEKTGAAVAQYLYKRGARKFGIVSASDPRTLLRNKGFVETAKKLGVREVPLSQWRSPSKLGDGRRGLAQLLETHPDLDAISCSSDFVALGVLIEAQARGIKVPEQLAVCGWGDLDFAADANPALSTVRIDGQAIGRQAARFIVDKIAGNPISTRVVDVGFSIVSRASA